MVSPDLLFVPRLLLRYCQHLEIVCHQDMVAAEVPEAASVNEDVLEPELGSLYNGPHVQIGLWYGEASWTGFRKTARHTSA